MATFGWKKKIGQNVIKSKSKAFEEDAKDDTEKAIESGEIDWLTLASQKTALVLEDAIIKSKRLQQEGTTLAQADRYWEAMLKWDQALQFTPNDEKLYEMKAQGYMVLNEVYPAVQAAEKAVLLHPVWWVAHQTLGRARLGLGEVRMAVKCFSRAIHLNPGEKELWQEDLKWSVELMGKKKLAEEQILSAIEEAENEEKCKIVELDEKKETGSCDPTTSSISADDMFNRKSYKRSLEEDSGGGADAMGEKVLDVTRPKKSRTLKSVPSNYVFMRD